nr:molecular chaperone DnaJ [Actinomycetota bacterium]
GRVRTRRDLTIKVPGGVDTGTRIRMSGEGEVGPAGGEAGDLYVEIAIRPHHTFQRRGDDLHCSIEVPMAAAALGATLTVETMDGPTEVDLRSGAQPQDTITLPGAGVTHLRGGNRGDLVVHLDVKVPTRLNEEQRRMLTDFAASRGESRPQGQMAPAQGGIFGKLKEAFSGR